MVQVGQWVPQPTLVDVEAGTASTQVTHFSGFQLADGSSPSAAYLPSLQGWQVSGFTGAASFSYPLDVPAGPAGIKPALTLSYQSDATDGAAGMRPRTQSSWVGKGWSLDTGAVALNKIAITNYSTVNYYALSFNGQSYDLVRAEALVGSPQGDDPTDWAWRATNAPYLKVRAVGNGNSTPGAVGAPGRGASDGGSPYPRVRWQIWETDGTLYEFAEDVWWGWEKCTGTGNGDFAYFESNRWLLSRVRDVHGNVIDYEYDRYRHYFNSCFAQAGTVDYDIWPRRISWGANPDAGDTTHRYKTEFISVARSNDTQFDEAAYTIGARRARPASCKLRRFGVIQPVAGNWPTSIALATITASIPTPAPVGTRRRVPVGGLIRRTRSGRSRACSASGAMIPPPCRQRGRAGCPPCQRGPLATRRVVVVGSERQLAGTVGTRSIMGRAAGGTWRMPTLPRRGTTSSLPIGTAGRAARSTMGTAIAIPGVIATERHRSTALARI
ncbi:hypothetical protein HC891_14960 [Candidatus Gracilibacteria bacterium]|nr:hypothetical protein [Candidatus Gracilibacteria bacterium]